MSTKIGLLLTTELRSQFFDDFSKLNRNKKQDLVHCASNTIEIYGAIFCPVCKWNDPHRTKKFKTTRQLWHHLIKLHKSDENSRPSLDSCKIWLQIVSDSLSGGLII